ncbi:hypothetical protein V8B97DRAFT_1862790 [Scleroderma yunnanense]
MDSLDYSGPPAYISARSADVILSDIRPTKLADDALTSINVLLDELLYSILNTARALTTPQLRAGLNKILPTTLGKEAVLEAEMELRAYWERTGGAPGTGSSQVSYDDGSFNLPWAFELLRLKCEAYSTLSDTDENAEAEVRLVERMNAEGTSLPKQSLLAPASLYLTAIIESICEHILSNVGRVVARDSSRATANSQDLFVALCEDSMIYGLFKNMKVYEQIELLSKLPNGRKSLSKSFSRERLVGTPSPTSESIRKDGSRNGSRQRLSSESSGSPSNIILNANHQSARSSVDKSRGIKIFNNRLPHDSSNGNEAQNGHQKTDSFASANAKQSVHSASDKSPVSPTFSADTRSQEFDDMMRSGSTMRFSLTPDRLRTMEVPNKEKSRQHGRQKGSAKTEKTSLSEQISASSPDPKRGPRTPLRSVDSIIEDEEDTVAPKFPPPSRPRQLSAATAAGYRASSFIRMRSASTSDPSVAKSTTAPPKLPTGFDSESHSTIPNSAVESTQRRRSPPTELNMGATKPSTSRLRVSLDVDDVMGDSDEDILGSSGRKSSQVSGKRKGLSTSTRELIDFLAEGPPGAPTLLSPTSNDSSLSLTPRKSGRLHKMISRITLSNESSKASRRLTGSHELSVSRNPSSANLSPLANRPVPPRYPTPSPPSATSSDRRSADQEAASIRQRSQSAPRIPITPENRTAVAKEQEPVPPIPAIIPESDFCNSPGTISKKLSDAALSKQTELSTKFDPVESPSTRSKCAESLAPTSPGISSAMPSPTPSTQPSPGLVESPPVVHIPVRVSSTGATSRSLPSQSSSPPSAVLASVTEHACDMRRALGHATSVQECRLLVDIFLARSKLIANAAELRALVASPQDSAKRELNATIENAVVGLFLGDGDVTIKRLDSDTTTSIPLVNGYAEYNDSS